MINDLFTPPPTWREIIRMIAADIRCMIFGSHK